MNIAKVLLTLLMTSTLLAETQPLYQYRSSRGNHLYTTSASLPAGMTGKWVNEGLIAWVPLPSATTRAVYSLVKADDLGLRYAYTVNPNEGGQGGWARQNEPAFHVSSKKLPGTTELYRLYLPLRQKSWGPEAGTDTHIYTTDLLRVGQSIGQGWINEGALGFVWDSPPLDLGGLAKPDLKPLGSSSGNDRGNDRKIKIKPQAAKVPNPTISLTGTKMQSDGRTLYSVRVTNASSYDSKFFVTTTGVLPKVACGDTRMMATVFVKQSGSRRRVHCEALTSQGALQSVDFKIATPLENDDAIYVMLEDRLLDERYTSDAYSAGWTGIAPLLGSVGCNSFLGRAGHYLCKDAKGLQACENLREAGKPIVCTQMGKKK